jgi:DNA-binding response OmpR family regulator
MADNSILIFVVEDEPLIRELLTQDLEEAGFSVALIASGDEAIKRLGDKTSNYRALITDINLGDDVTGWDVARHARRINPDLPVIYMTGNSANEWAVNGVPNSIMIGKPFVGAQVVSAIAQLLNSGNTPGA